MNKTEVTKEDVEIAAARCLTAWSRVEIAVTELFLTLNHAERDFAPVAARHPLGIAIDAIQSVEARFRVVNEFIRADPRLDEKFKKAWNATYNNLNRQRGRRNEIGHFSIGHTPHAKPHLRWQLLPYFSVSRFLHGRSEKPISHEMLCARNKSFHATRERVTRLSQYIRVTRDNALIAGQPVADPDRLLDNPNVQTSKGSASRIQSSQG